MSAMTTFAPSSASAMAMPKPMPEAAPVTMAVLPEMSIATEPFGWFDEQTVTLSVKARSLWGDVTLPDRELVDFPLCARSGRTSRRQRHKAAQTKAREGLGPTTIQLSTARLREW